jgi:hypothetical protein
LKEDGMITLNIDTEEADILIELLDACISDMRVEIHSTENLDYKEMLKRKKEILIKLQTAIQDSQE